MILQTPDMAKAQIAMTLATLAYDTDTQLTQIYSI